MPNFPVVHATSGLGLSLLNHAVILTADCLLTSSSAKRSCSQVWLWWVNSVFHWWARLVVKFLVKRRDSWRDEECSNWSYFARQRQAWTMLEQDVVEAVTTFGSWYCHCSGVRRQSMPLLVLAWITKQSCSSFTLENSSKHCILDFLISNDRSFWICVFKNSLDSVVP